VPRGVVHNFKNETDEPAQMLIVFAPAGIEWMFSAMAKEPVRFLEIAAEYGVTFPSEE
jgi:mannose-6-phosphate isomerase-like protein (cupin superfamily)